MKKNFIDGCLARIANFQKNKIFHYVMNICTKYGVQHGAVLTLPELCGGKHKEEGKSNILIIKHVNECPTPQWKTYLKAAKQAESLG